MTPSRCALTGDLPRARRVRAWFVRLDRLLFAGGLILIAAWVALVSGEQLFQRVAGHKLVQKLAAHGGAPSAGRSTRAASEGEALGRIRIPRLGLSSVIVSGTSVLSLYLGVGHMNGTAFPGDPGDIVLAGHRDTVFRPLQNVRVGDLIEVSSPSGVTHYAVVSATVLRPDLIRLNRHDPRSTLTLITCYPFHYIGPAPDRFVVVARAVTAPCSPTLAGATAIPILQSSLPNLQR